MWGVKTELSDAPVYMHYKKHMKCEHILQIRMLQHGSINISFRRVAAANVWYVCFCRFNAHSDGGLQLHSISVQRSRPHTVGRGKTLMSLWFSSTLPAQLLFLRPPVISVVHLDYVSSSSHLTLPAGFRPVALRQSPTVHENTPTELLRADLRPPPHLYFSHY